MFAGAIAAPAISAVLEVFNFAGGGGINVGPPLQRFLRNILAMRNRPFGVPEPRASAWAKAVRGLSPEPFNPASAPGLV